MKTKALFLTFLRTRYAIFLLSSFSLFSVENSYGQIETHDFVTYDTTFSAGGQNWIARISRPVNMFTPNHPDTASRPALITMPGVGEVGTNYANLQKYGPHYWLNNGWDGKIVTGNGIHYPIIITVISTVTNPRVNRAIAMLQFLLSTYHIKPNSVHLGGLSMGAFTWAGLINGQLSNGGEEGMKMVTSLVLLQGAGQGATSGIMGSAIPYDATGYSAFGHWATKYGGTFLGLEGTSDTRNVWQPRDNINDSVLGAGYFAFENIGGGGHCCWNTMYDPNRKNWSNQQGNLGTNIVWNTIHNNTMGTYKNGWSLLEWMFRQGDTTLVGSPGSGNSSPVANAGSNQTITLPVNTVTLNGSGTDPDGSIASYQWTKLTGPSQYTIVSATQAQTVVDNLAVGVYNFELRVTDNDGAIDKDTVQVTVNATPVPNQVPGANAGNNQTITLPVSTVTLNGSGTDPDGSIVSYQWTKLTGPAQYIIVSATQAQTLVNNLAQGVYGFELSVTDNEGAVGHDTIQITVNAAPPINQAPTANAGSNQTITLPVNTITLNGSGTDPDGSIASYQWTKLTGPVQYTIVSATQAQTVVNNLMQGVYSFSLTVTDNSNASSSDTVVITVNANQTVAYIPSGKKIVGPGEYQSYFIDEAGYLWGIGNISNIGTNNTGTVGIAYKAQVTAGMKFIMAAGGLHGGGAVDTTGHVWILGDNDQYQMGIGNNTQPIYIPSKIVTDSAGNEFGNVKSIAAFYVKNLGDGYNGFYAIKNDGTLWGWGRMVFGMRGDGTSGADKSRPVQIIIPGNRKVKQVVAGQFAIALCEDGTVWVWGEGVSNSNIGYSGSTEDKWSPHQLTGLTSITQIAGGMLWNYALDASGVLYGWGAYGERMGNANGLPISTPTPLNTITNALPSPIKKIVTNSAVTHVILADSTLWGWGDNGQGTVGNGQRLNFQLNGGNPFNRNNLDVVLPVQIAPGIKFDTVFGGSTYTYHTYARDINDSLYSWGRGKGAVLGNWLQPANPAITATYGNSWDIAYPTPVDPFNIGVAYVQTSDYCVKVSSSGTPCNGYSIPANTKPVANAGLDQNITNYTTTLNATGSTDNVFISRYEWTQVSGPNTAIIDLPASKTPTVRNLVDGNYIFKLLVEDNGWLLDSITITVNVNVAPNQLPSSNAGSNQTITLPVNTVTLNGSGTDPDGSIASYQWTKLTGPAQFTIVSVTQSQTVVNNLVQGVYSFELRVTDNQGAIGRDTVQIIVNAPPISNAGPDKNITLPVNSTTLTGSGTDPDGSIASYQWAKLTGPAQFVVISPTQAQTVLNNLVQGVYTFELTVTDNRGAIDRDTVRVIVNAIPPPTNQSPTANAGTDQTITLPVNSITVTGSGTDPDGTISFYQWAKLTGPSQFVIVNADQAQTIINSLIEGVYTFELTVTDNQGAIDKDTLQITVNAAAPTNQVPTANAGNNQTITLPVNTVTLNGIGTDSDGSIVSYLWTKLAGPTQFTIVSAIQAQTVINNLVQGIYNFELRVTDNKGAIGRDTMQIIVNAQPSNKLPTADAGVDSVIYLPNNSIKVTGIGSDIDGFIVSNSWLKISGSVQYKISSSNTLQTTFEDLVVGKYEFELTVTDDRGGVGKDTILITVLPDLRKQSTARLYPNPATSDINIVIDAITNSNKTKIQIVDALGKNVYYTEVMRTQQVFSIPVDVSRFPKGTYFVKVGSDINTSKTITFVKQ